MNQNNIYYGPHLPECCTCYESVNEPPLKCGHYIHRECISKGHAPRCHLCRAFVDIKVTGNLYDDVDEEGNVIDSIIMLSQEGVQQISLRSFLNSFEISGIPQNILGDIVELNMINNI